jgi:hypothetical protein
MEYKTCKKCNISHPLSMYNKNKNNIGGYIIYCKPCKSEMDKIYRKNNPEKIKSLHKTYYDENRDIIVEKSKQYQRENIERRKSYNKENRERDKQYLLQYNKNHKEKIQPLRKKYNEDNRDKINEYQNNLYRTNLNHKLSSLYRCRIYIAIKDNSKSKKTMEILGCSVYEFISYLEKKFLPEMTWENHGDIWEIDHILPCASFDFTQEGDLEKCFHYFNHQPLFKTTEIAESFGYTDQIGNRNKLNKLL